MKTAQSIFETLEARRKELGLSQAEVGRRALGQSDGSALQNMKRGSSPSPENLDKICAVLDLDFYIGPRRESGPVAQMTLNGADYIHVPLHDAALSAGPGAENGGRNVIDHLAFRRDWMRRIGISPTSACLARIDRDSMVPTLFPGDIVLIDTSRTEVPVHRNSKGSYRRASIYAFVEDGQARVKRIERAEPSAIILLSDNPDYPPELRTGAQIEALQMSIIGKVVWWGHTSKD
ncbi:MAG: hypothetical protein CFE33_15240 [Pseudorhodobacter sp. PARRP1]|nr:MAG: hypothetical protein CFE33_15240 [Pseudorhodobacter sp. PARRP1]